jgi:hypothetical protein
MDDQFLYQLSEQPDAQFAEELHKKLSRYDTVEQSQAPKVSLFRLSRALVWGAALLLILLVAAASLVPVRAFIETLIAQIGGQSFELTEDYPGDNYPGEEVTIEPQHLAYAEALAVFPYELKVPTNLPAGYALQEQDVYVYVGEQAGSFANTIELQWRSDPGMQYYFLRITDMDYASVSEIVGPGSVEEILLDEEHPAVLIRGGWDAGRKVWDPAIGLRLRWQVGELYYELSGPDLEVMKAMALSTLQ